jgi:xylan 1,4-beta-xylosidase
MVFKNSNNALAMVGKVFRSNMKLSHLAAVVLCSVWAGVYAGKTALGQGTFPVTIRVNMEATQGPLRPLWRYFGADEPNYAYMKHGSKLLGELGDLSPHNVFFRTHNLLTSGDGTPALKWGSTNAYTEDAAGRPVYDWTIVDRIFDTYLTQGVRPYVQIGFMPKALSSKPDPYQHKFGKGATFDELFCGWAQPPKDYDKWGELVYQWVRHCVERYGPEEVLQWYWQTWNEADIPYWKGTPEQFFKLHDVASASVRRALPNARVGGPDTANGGSKFMQDFLTHCVQGKNFATGETGTPLDFVSFHAKGAPEVVEGHIQMGIHKHLQAIESGLRTIAQFPSLKSLPIILGESDPEGCAACRDQRYAYRNGTMYSSYTAASFARKHDLADKHGVNLEGALTWAFTFEEQPYFAGFRQLASNGLPLPVLNVFRMMSKMQGDRVATTSSHAIALEDMINLGVRKAPDVAALASRTDKQLAVMIWHYHDDDTPGPAAAVELQIDGLPVKQTSAKVTHYRVDQFHSNAYDSWRRMGSPVAPDKDQHAALESESQLTQLRETEPMKAEQKVGTLAFKLPRQGVSLIVIDYP